MNYYTAGKYLTYKLFSSHKRGHGIHSPFIFKFITKVFRNKISREVVLNIEGIRKMMLSDLRVIKVTDYGSGSGRKGGAVRKVSDIVKKSSIPRKYGRLLSNLAAEYGRDCVIELGTSVGISAMYLASGAPTAVVHTIEGCPEVSVISEENFRRGGFSNIRLYTGTFTDVLGMFEKLKMAPGLVYIDGDHRKESVLNYFEKLYRMSDERSVFVFDDIHSSSAMGEAWGAIVSDSRVTLSIDLFRMGLVFFRKGLTPSGYRIRY
jgi:predicted O-methyltransferase YrrM